MNSSAQRVGLPPRPFLYTLDQIAYLLAVDTVDKYVHFDGRTLGLPNREQLKAMNIAPRGETPDWRVEEMELVRWLKAKGFVVVRRQPRY